jgi:L-alanine-DL-glutamate epimerase-like enolase superfamily enzyme
MAARAVLDLLLHDRQARVAGLPMSEHLARTYGLEPSEPEPPSSYTIGLDTTERMVEKVAEASSYPILKVKLGTERDVEILRAIRGATDAVLRVDANAAWTVEETRGMAPRLVELGVELLEQPLERSDLDGYAALHGTLPLPVFVDESVRHEDDVERLDGRVDGINLKLAKCGGLGPCARMVAEARRRGLGVMLGCFVESSISISAGAALSRFVDYADLDGAALLAEEPYVGASIAGGRIVVPPGPGLAVRRR